MDTETKCTFRKIHRHKHLYGIKETFEHFAPCYKEQCSAFYDGKCVKLFGYNFREDKKIRNIGRTRTNEIMDSLDVNGLSLKRGSRIHGIEM